MSLPVWRSQLFIPATSERFIAKGPEVGADALILDLEDSVAARAKASARASAPDVVRGFAARGIDTLVRINRPWRLAVPDLEAVVIPELTAVLCPMVDSAEHVVALSETVAELEAERGIPAGRIRLCLAVETAKGYLNLRAIAHADPRSVALSLGSEDFGLSMGMTPDEETLYGPKQQVVACAAEAGLLPMGFVGSIAQFRDIDRVPPHRAAVEEDGPPGSHLHPPEPGAGLQRGVRAERGGSRGGKTHRRGLRRGASARRGRDQRGRQDGGRPGSRPRAGRAVDRRRAGRPPGPLNARRPAARPARGCRRRPAVSVAMPGMGQNCPIDGCTERERS